jgi:GNAT superfamily N-acetyltransferase
MDFPASFLEHNREAWRYQYLHGLNTAVVETPSWAAFRSQDGAVFMPGRRYDDVEAADSVPAPHPGSCLVAPAWWTKAAMDAGWHFHHWRSGWVFLPDVKAPRRRKGAPKVGLERVETTVQCVRFRRVVENAVPGCDHLWGDQEQLIGDQVQAWTGVVGKGQPVGTVALFFTGHLASIQLLSVLPVQRKRGIGEVLVREALKVAWQRNVVRVDMEAMPAAHSIPKRLGAYELLRFGFWTGVKV